MNQRNFFSELKRRNVYKVAVAYAIVAWLLIQAAAIPYMSSRRCSQRSTREDLLTAVRHY